MREYIGKTCPYCKTPLTAGDAVVFCDTCELPHHLSCWQDNGSCATFGCTGKIAEFIGVNPPAAQPASVASPYASASAAPVTTSHTMEIVTESRERVFLANVPLLLENVALITDRANGNLFARCTFRNLSDAVIKAVLIEVSCQDVWGNTVGQPVPHQYLDLNAAGNGTFGRSQPIVIPDRQTRGIQVAVKKVLFDGGAVVECTGVAFTAPAPVLLREHLGSDALVAQFRRETTEKAQYMPSQADKYQCCTCGALYADVAVLCPVCGCTKEQLEAALDVEALTERERVYTQEETRRRDIARAAEEERIRLQEQETRRRILREEMIREEVAAEKRRKKIVGIALGIVAALIVTVILISVLGEPYRKYDEACEYMEYMSRDGYSEAIELFVELGDFQDSREKAAACVYALVDNTLVEDDYFYESSEYGDYLTPNYRRQVYDRVLEHINAHPELSYWLSDGENLHAESIGNVLALLPDSYENVSVLKQLFEDVDREWYIYGDNGDYIRENRVFLESVWDIGFVQSFLLADEQITYFMEGYWETSSGDYYVEFYEDEDDGSTWSRYNLPGDKPSKAKYYDVVNCIYIYEDENSNELSKVLKFTFVDYNTISVYCYKNGRTYKLYRD